MNLNLEEQKAATAGTATTQYDCASTTDLNHLESTTGYLLPPSFDSKQILEAQGMPRIATESVTACVMGVRLALLRGMRSQGYGPRHRVDRSGRVSYHRSDVLAYMHAHEREGEL